MAIGDKKGGSFIDINKAADEKKERDGALEAKASGKTSLDYGVDDAVKIIGGIKELDELKRFVPTAQERKPIMDAVEGKLKTINKIDVGGEKQENKPSVITPLTPANTPNPKV